ncbi:hypothetical protein, partial [Klebsiella aerogenes]|uniref:hypothetical protein n=1 Tax=Klebsiella aerogenes TaxID=548 RepID=UPI001EF77B9D
MNEPRPDPQSFRARFAAGGYDWLQSETAAGAPAALGDEMLMNRFVARALRAVAVLAAVATIALPAAAHAQTWPTRPITLVVPFTAGT